MRLNDILTELTFRGSTCTKDCSGHRAGFAWGQKTGGMVSNGTSPSFNKGTRLAANTFRRKQGGGKVAGIVSQTPSAVRKRAARAANKI